MIRISAVRDLSGVILGLRASPEPPGLPFARASESESVAELRADDPAELPDLNVKLKCCFVN